MDNSLKILQIVDSLNSGGTERMSINIYNMLTKKGIANKLFVTRRTGILEEFLVNKNNYVIFNKKHFLDLKTFFKIYKSIKLFNPNIIHVHQTSIYWTIFFNFFLSNNIKIIWHDHWGYSDLLGDSDRRVIRYLSHFIDGVICVNEKIKKWNITHLKLKEDRIIYIPNFPLINFNKTSLRNSNNVLEIVCLANIRYQKDHENLIEAASLLREKGLKFKLTLAGSIENNDYVNKIKSLIKERQLTNYVEFLGSISAVSNLLSSADIGVLSSKSEGLPVALLEYGLAELPVVCTNVGQCSDVLGDGKYGWLVPPKNSELLADSLMEVMNNIEKANNKGKLFREFVIKKYGINNFYEKYIKFLNSINE